MFVQHLSVADFRSWTRADLSLEPGVSVLAELVGASAWASVFGSLDLVLAALAAAAAAWALRTL